MTKAESKKLLIVTQKVDKNDPILGFFHEWIVGFSKQFESVIVVCLQEGEHNLPGNVNVRSLGKERGFSRLAYLWNFYRYVFSLQKKYDFVFVHMNPIYVILAGPIWRIMGKKITLWYVHKMVDLKLRIAVTFANKILTASRESFRLPTKKLEIVGHGIDTEHFSPGSRTRTSQYIILSVGRISETKNQLLIVQALEKLIQKNFLAKLVIVGAGITRQDKQYENQIREYVNSNGLQEAVEFVGNVSPSEILRWYQGSDLMINLSSTGSMDKAVLEAMSCGLDILTSNEAFESIVPDDNFTHNDPDEIAKKIAPRSSATGGGFRKYVIENHDIHKLIPRVSEIISNL